MMGMRRRRMVGLVEWVSVLLVYWRRLDEVYE
jgi:hypothetical protein